MYWEINDYQPDSHIVFQISLLLELRSYNYPNHSSYFVVMYTFILVLFNEEFPLFSANKNENENESCSCKLYNQLNQLYS